MNIYVGNLLFNVGEDDLRDAFEQFGQVTEVRLIMDKLAANRRDLASLKCHRKTRQKKLSKK